MLLDGKLAHCEPKALHYRLLHAARLTHGQRHTYRHRAQPWLWTLELAPAFADRLKGGCL